MNETTWAGTLLVAGFVLFLVGAALWKPAVYQQELAAALPAMAADRRRLRWILSWMMVGVTVTTLAMALLTSVIRSQGERVLPVLGLGLFGLGAVLWLAALVFRRTVGEWAADQTVSTGAIPAGYEAWDRWAGSIHSFHMLTAFASWSLFGEALVTAGLTPSWIGWAGVVAGVILSAGFVALKGGPLSPPILAHVYPLVVGIALLV